MQRFEVVVLGTGPAATRVATACGKAGRRVAVADPRPFGGTCALRGCNPKKVLVRAAEFHDWARRSAGTGLRVDGARIVWPELIAFKRSFTEPVTPAKEKSFQNLGIKGFHGAPRFVSANRIAVDEEELESERIVVATGAVPRRLGIPGEELATLSDEFLELDQLPPRVLFIGGGYIAFEFAHVAARAGAEVVIIEMGERPLAPFEPELVEGLVEATRELGVVLRTSTEVRSIEQQAGEGLAVVARSGDVEQTLHADLVVHGAGRVPNVKGLDLETGRVRYSARGIEVNDYLQSVSNSAVYAAGDVAATGAPPLSPVAGVDGWTLAHNLLHPDRRKPDYRGTATVVFSVPALAAVGMSEQAAREQGLRISVHAGDRSGFNSMKKVRAKHARYKVIIDEDSDCILGAHLLGPDAGETINLFALAIRHGITASQLKATPLAFPSFAQDARSMV